MFKWRDFQFKFIGRWDEFISMDFIEQQNEEVLKFLNATFPQPPPKFGAWLQYFNPRAWRR